jgi:hypothetical protein
MTPPRVSGAFFASHNGLDTSAVTLDHGGLNLDEKLIHEERRREAERV